MSRKAVTVAVVAATIAWSIGLAALVAPLAASAATPASGSLIKASLPAVYYMGANGKRYVFPNEKTYKTWYVDFSTVQVITDAELAALPIGGNATYKPGVKMVKITTDPKVYAVDAGGTLRWVTSEAIASSLYGTNWNTKIDDVSDAFFTNYSLGADVASASAFSPAGATSQATSINQDKGLSSGADVSGVLSTVLASGQPAGGSLPGGATGVNMLKFDVRNGGSSAMTVDSLTVKRTGPGATGDFLNVYVYDGTSRLTTGRTFNATSHEASFGGLNLSVPAGTTKALWIATDLAQAPGAGNVHALSIVDLRSGSTMSSGLPISGNSFTMATAQAGTVTINRSGATPLANVKAGGMNQKVGEFQLTAGAAEDINLAKVALFRGGAVSRSNMSNLVLKQAGNTLASTAGYDSNDRATFVLSTPMLIEKGSSKTFEVFSDIAAGSRTGATETILSYLDQTTDLLAVGRTYGYGVRVIQGAPAFDGVTGGACALGAASCSSTRIEGGQVTITFNGPAAKDIGSNAKDVELYNFTLAAQANLEIRNLRMQITSVAAGADDDADRGDLVDDTGDAAKDADDVANFTDLKVVDTATGAIVAGPLELVVGAAYNDMTQLLTYTQVITLSAGQSRTFKVTGDVANNTNADFLNDQARVDLLAFAANDVRNLDNSTYVAVTDIVPNAQVNGNGHTVKAPSLTVNTASTPVAQTYIQGGQGVALAGFTLQAGDASDVRVSQLQLQGNIDDDLNAAFQNGQDTGANTVAATVLSAKLWNGSTQIGDTKSPSASTGANTGGLLTFDNLNLTVPKGSTLTLNLTGNLSSSIAGLADDIRWQVFAAGSVSATDPDGNTVNAIAAAFPVTGAVMRVANAGTLTVALAPDDAESEAGILVGGTSNAVLAKYKFTAQNEELKLTKARLSTATANGLSSVSLYDGSTLVGGPVSVGGGGLADFSSVNFVVPKDGSKTLTVKGNLSSVGTSGAASGSAVTMTLRDGGATDGADAGTFEVRGTSSGSNTLITLFGANTAAANTYTMVDAACVAAETYTATINGTAVLYTALGGDCGGADAADTDAIMAALALAIDANVTVGPLVNAAYNAGTNTLTVTAVTAGTPGNAITTTAADTSVAGVLVATGATLVGGLDGDLAGNIKALRRTKPTVSLVALPSTVLSNGDQTLLRFTVSADAAGDVALKHLQVIVNKSATPTVALTAASNLRRVGDSSNLAGSAALTGTSGTFPGAGTGTGTLDILLTNEEVITAGTSRTYDVRLTVGGTNIAGNSISSSLGGENPAATGTETGLVTSAGAGLAEVAAAARDFVWSDISAVPHTDNVAASSADWANGTYVKVLPTDTQTMSL